MAHPEPKHGIEEMAEWSAGHPSQGHDHAGSARIMKHFQCGMSRACEAARMAAAQSGARQTVPDSAEKEAGEGLRYEESGQTAHLTTVSREIKTLDDALAYAEVDTDKWEVERYLVNSWEMASKDADKRPQVTPLWQVKVWLKRRLKSAVEAALEHLIERIPKAKPVRRKPVSRAGNLMVEVALYDLHFGMLAWAPETDENYDVSIARRVTEDAVAQIAERTRDMKVERFLFPIGNDLFHVNDPTGLTPTSKNILDVDSRLAKITEEAAETLRGAVSLLSEKAPVKLTWVPGNHDPQTSYYLLRELAAHYRNDKRVEVDTSPRPRKVEVYGVNLLWLLHGCDLAAKNEKAMAGLMASECADVWRPNQYREIHRGHTHKKQELWFTGAETYGGVVVRTIPSLVATDAWHFSKGYVKTTKTAQFFVWNKDYGLESVHDVHVDPAHFREHEEQRDAS